MSCRNRNGVAITPYTSAQQQAFKKAGIPMSARITFGVMAILLISLVSVWIWDRPEAKSAGADLPSLTEPPAEETGETETPVTGCIQITNPVPEEIAGTQAETPPPSVESVEMWPDSRSSELQALLESVSGKLESSLPTMGDTVETSLWKITLTEAREYETLDGEDYFDFASEGCKLLVLFFDLENTSDSEADFDLYKIKSAVDGQSTYCWTTMNNPDGYEQLHGVLAPGAVKKGCLVYEVPDGWEELTLSYKSSWDAEDSDIINFQLFHGQISE